MTLTIRKYTPAVVKSHEEELVIENPIFEPDRVVFSFDGRMNQIIDVHFEKAQLTGDTFARFQSKAVPPPVEAQAIDLVTDLSMQPTTQSENRTCLAFLKVEVAPASSFPTSERFFQLSSSITQRDFYMQVDSDLLVSMKVSPLLTAVDSPAVWPSGCRKLLKVGNWEWHNAGYWEILVKAAANYPIHLSISGLWKDAKEPFQPFNFGATPLQARAISINKLTSSNDGPALLNVSASPGTFLNISTFTLNSEQIQLDYSGRAFVKIRGKYVTASFRDYFKRYPLFEAILTPAILALVGWCLLTLRLLFRGARQDN